MHKFLVLILLLTSTFIYGEGIGTVVTLKGQALVKQLPLQKEDIISEGDIIVTGAKSFIRLKMNDKTMINIGPNSTLDLKTYRLNEGKRQNYLSLVKGKMRILVKEKAKSGEKIQIKVKQVSIGVRGTEIITNAYEAAGSPSSDILLVKGKTTISGPGFNSFDLKPGQYINSQDLFKNGLKAVKNLDPELLGQLKTAGEEFIPQLQNFSGKLIDFGGSLKKQLSLAGVNAGIVGALGGAGALVGAGAKALVASDDKKEEKKPIKKPVVAPKKKKSKGKVKGPKSFKYNLAKEPWNIRDAVLNYKKRTKDNECFYFFYKKLPGSGEAQLFRRERDCDEYDFDL